MTSAAPLSVVLSLLSQKKEGKRGRSVSHVLKGYIDYILESISSILTFQNTPPCAYGDIFFLISEKACSYSYDIYSILEYFFEKP